MKVVRTNPYERGLKRLKKLGATEDDIDGMEREIASNPEIGDVIPGAGGLRKVRFAYGRIGKRGGGRTIYYRVREDDTVYLLAAYAKIDRDDITADEKRLLRALVRELTDG